MLDAARLAQFTPLHNLAPDNLARLARRLSVEEIPKGDVICREGDTDNVTLFLLEGGVELKSHGTSMNRVLQAGSPDAFFPLAPGRPRPYTVTATMPVRLFRVDNAALDRAVLLDEVSTTVSRIHDSGEAFQGDSAWLEEMMQHPAFRMLPRERLAMLLLKLEPRALGRGDTLIRQGDPADYYYIVKAGRLALSHQEDGGQARRIGELNPGSVFGEEALMSGKPCQVSIQAQVDCLVMCLPRHEFDTLLRKPLARPVSVNEAQVMLKAGAGLLDVRSPKEFNQGSIKGGVNLPIAELRSRWVELDRKRPYVLYCRNGTQSEAAAFMLAQRGFQVVVLQGGLQSLPRTQR